MPADELVDETRGHRCQREPAVLGAETGVEDHLEEDVAELVGEMGGSALFVERVATRLRDAQRAYGSCELVGLLDAVPGQ